jgi:hypothetical protein
MPLMVSAFLFHNFHLTVIPSSDACKHFFSLRKAQVAFFYKITHINSSLIVIIHAFDPVILDIEYGPADIKKSVNPYTSAVEVASYEELSGS